MYNFVHSAIALCTQYISAVLHDAGAVLSRNVDDVVSINENLPYNGSSHVCIFKEYSN